MKTNGALTSRCAWLVGAVALSTAFSCSSAEPGGTATATGGAFVTAVGGATVGNGGSVVSSGGTANGGASVGNGGSSTGGKATGGNANVGGSATGGKTTGGTANVGGSATGGKTTGGNANVGGSTAGGNANVGGSATGGNANVGGSTNTGGNSATGGSNGTCNVPPIASSTCATGDSNCFSFFVASRARMFELAEAFGRGTSGWGGDFTYGTGDGLKGADKLCTEIAELSLPGNCRTWKAFLSTSSVNAISRVGNGPWYDRLNRLIASNLTQLVATRPGGITNSTIKHNIPNEDGTPHHNEEAGCTNLNSCADNHDVLTGSDSDGKVCTSSTCAGKGGPGGGGESITDFTCNNWTLGTAQSGIAPRVGHTWPT